MIHSIVRLKKKKNLFWEFTALQLSWSLSVFGTARCLLVTQQSKEIRSSYSLLIRLQIKISTNVEEESKTLQMNWNTKTFVQVWSSKHKISSYEHSKSPQEDSSYEMSQNTENCRCYMYQRTTFPWQWLFGTYHIGSCMLDHIK